MLKLINQPGYVAVMSAIIIGAITTTLVVSILSISINYSQNNLLTLRRVEAKMFANSCAEVSLQAIADGLILSEKSLKFDNGDCSAIINQLPDNGWQINSYGNSFRSTQRIKVVATKKSSGLIIESWQYVDGFKL